MITLVGYSTTIIACIARWRLIGQSLQFYRLKITTTLVLLGLSILGVVSIISFPHLYTYVTSQSRISPLNIQSAVSYLAYSAIRGLMVGVIVFYRNSSQITQQQLTFLLVILIISIILPLIGWYPLYYYLIAAGVEEYIKYYLGLGTFKLYGIIGSDIILFGMLSGLGFACVENIVYLLTGGFDHSQIIRWFIGPIVHMIYSGGIAYGYWFLNNRGYGILGLCISSLLMILTHTGYNSFVEVLSRPIISIIIIGGYFLISRMLYQCDRLYFETKNNLKTTL